MLQELILPLPVNFKLAIHLQERETRKSSLFSTFYMSWIYFCPNEFSNGKQAVGHWANELYIKA